MNRRTGEPSRSYWTVIEPIRESVRLSNPPTVVLEEFRQLPVAIGHLFAAHCCQSEIRNGGFAQFFENSAGVLAPEALAGFKAIGLHGFADLLEQAMKHFGRRYPRDRRERRAELARLTGSDPDLDDELEMPGLFESLDDRFFELLNPPVLVESQSDAFCQAADRYAASI